ncbi:kinase-like domain-containing protein [Annulohypoxylon moriforme]|nr:kinase-like domain-containing protein [Annulohypoxylon moriforme]
MFSNFYHSEKKEKIEDYQQLGERLYKEEKFESAEDAFRREVEERDIGSSDMDTDAFNRVACSVYWLAAAILRQEEPKRKTLEAESLLLIALKRLGDTSKRKENWVIDTIKLLGKAKFYKGEYAEAEKYLRNATESREKIWGTGDIRSLRCAYWLARCCYAQYYYMEAEGLFRTLAERSILLCGTHDANTITNMHWLARCCSDQEKYEEAEHYFRYTIEKTGVIPAMASGETLLSVVCIGDIYIQQCKYFEAERHLRDIPNRCEAVFGKEHMDTLWCKHLLAIAYYRQEKYDKAAAPLQEAVQGWKKLNQQEFLDKMKIEDKLREVLLKKAPYTNEEIIRISSEFNDEHSEKSYVQRTRVLLRDIDCLQLLNGLIEAGFSDYMFPITEKSLPEVFSPTQRSRFVEMQSQVMGLSSDPIKDGHCYFMEIERIPLKSEQELGDGAFGKVDMVLSRRNGMKYARKQINRDKVFWGVKKNDRMKQLAAEIKILERINHRHIVQFVGSYTDPEYVSLIMSPVAEMNLATYLKGADQSKKSELRTFFGCLCTAVQFLHEEGVRHKDIKPENILVHRGTVFLTDFGLSFDFADQGRSTTEGPVNGRTARYAPREVYDFKPRNTRSDIWSLGVVFLEMATILKGKSIKEMDKFLETHGTGGKTPSLNHNALLGFIERLERTGSKSDNVVLKYVRKMLRKQVKNRPSAKVLVELIKKDGAKSGFHGKCCSL